MKNILLYLKSPRREAGPPSPPTWAEAPGPSAEAISYQFSVGASGGAILGTQRYFSKRFLIWIFQASGVAIYPNTLSWYF